MKFNDIVVFPTKDQYSLKHGELLLGSCYWTIPFFPKNRENLISRKIYFYLKEHNLIVDRATIIGFGEKEKKYILFENKEEDIDFEYIYLDELCIEKRKQNRGWAYRWFPDAIPILNAEDFREVRNNITNFIMKNDRKRKII